MLFSKIKKISHSFPFIPEELSPEENFNFQKFCEILLSNKSANSHLDPFKLAGQAGINLAKIKKESYLSTYLWVAFLSFNSGVYRYINIF